MKKDIVAILGRPNVGKSTLFNRIIRKRQAIVDNVPGVTRDRHYALAEWAGKEFDLVDTGGYIPLSNDIFEKAIRKQVQYALAEANLVVFLTDVIDGVLPLDEEIAQILKQCNIPVLLGVNKVDSETREPDIDEFYRLGIGQPHPLSAISGRSVGDFLDKIVESLPGEQTLVKESKVISLAIIGKPNVGKSSYINAILGEDKLIVTDIPGTTRDSIDTMVRYQKKDIVLIDTAGLRKKSRVMENVEYFSTVRTRHAIRRCDVAILLIDAKEPLTEQDKKIISMLIQDRKGIVLGVNKWDLVEKNTHTARYLEQDMHEKVRELSFIPIFFISVLEKQRIFKLLDLAITVYEERKRKISTGELNRVLKMALQKAHPPAFGDKHIKINYVTQTRIEPPTFTFFTNEPKGIKKNYRNYLENQFRTQFGFLGVPLVFKFRKKN